MPAPPENEGISRLVQSPPLNLTAPYNSSTLCGKTVLITGAASGFGAAISRRWAQLGANIIATDISDAAGEKLVAELRLLPDTPETDGKNGNKNKVTPSKRHHYVHLDVSSWVSSASAFRIAAQELSPTGRIDIVLANAGIVESSNRPEGITVPADASALLTAGLPGFSEPPEPRLDVLQTNLIGVAYTVHLALFWLGQNGTAPFGTAGVDRSILLFGSMASVIGLPGAPQYCAAKHGVMGLFRSLRGMPNVSQQGRGVRINLLCPYFVDTPIVPVMGRLFLAGGGMADISEVVEGATRLIADESIAGRALVIGPKVKVQGSGNDEELVLVDAPESISMEDNSSQVGETNIRSAWEIYAEDFVTTEAFVRRFVVLLYNVERIRGWAGDRKSVV